MVANGGEGVDAKTRTSRSATSGRPSGTTIVDLKDGQALGLSSMGRPAATQFLSVGEAGPPSRSQEHALFQHHLRYFRAHLSHQ